MYFAFRNSLKKIRKFRVDCFTNIRFAFLRYCPRIKHPGRRKAVGGELVRKYLFTLYLAQGALRARLELEIDEGLQVGGDELIHHKHHNCNQDAQQRQRE